MSMSNGVLSTGSWATESAGQALLDSIKPVVRRSNGTYEDLDKRNPSNLASGGGANLSTLGNDFLTYFANTFQWLSISKSGNIVSVKYATEQVDDTYHNYAFLGNDGQAKEGFSIGAVFGQSSGGNLYSSPESASPEQMALTNAINYAENRGATADVATWDMKNYISGLFPLLFRTLNGQAHMWGNNPNDGGSYSQNTVLTFTNDYGMNGTTANQTSKMAFLWIHDFWGNSYWWVGGAKTSPNKLMVQHGKRSSTSDEDFTNTGIGPSSILSGPINKMYATDTEVGFFPQDDGGSYTTYYCDHGNVSPSAFSYVGGRHRGLSRTAGPFFVEFNSSASNTLAVRLAFKEGENKA